MRRLFACLTLAIGTALAVSGCGSSTGLVQVKSNTPSSVRDFEIEKRPDCDSNDFTISGVVWSGGGVYTLRLLDSSEKSTPGTATAYLGENLTITATAIAGVSSTFGLFEGSETLVARIKTYGLLDKDCGMFSWP